MNPASPRPDPIARFWARVPDGPGCREWTAGRHTWGYGVLSWKGKARTAHRLAWELTFGPIPAGLHVLHRCDNPPCCNPEHLFLGTQADNNRDMIRKGRCHLPMTGRPAPPRRFRLISPSGELVEGLNVRQFALKHGLSTQNLGAVLHGRREHHRGWRRG